MRSQNAKVSGLRVVSYVCVTDCVKMADWFDRYKSESNSVLLPKKILRQIMEIERRSECATREWPLMGQL